MGGGVGFPFLSFLCSLIQKTVFSPRQGQFLLIFESLPLFLLSLFWPPPFSISLSLSLSCFFFSSFLSFFLLSFGSFFLSLAFLLFLFCFCFMKGTASEHLIAISFFHQSSVLFSTSCLVFFFQIFFLSLFFFLILSYVFVQHECFWFQNKRLKNKTHVGSRGGLQQNVLFYQPVFCKMWKSYRFSGGGAFFGQILVEVQKKHYKIGISARVHFFFENKICWNPIL